MINIDIRNMLNTSIPYLAYVLVLLALWIMFSESIISVLNRNINTKRFREYLRNEQKKNEHMFIAHIRSALLVVFQTNKTSDMYFFFGISGLLMFIGLLFFSKHGSMANAVIFSLLMGFIPYGYLHLKLSVIRIESSYEGEGVITELSNQYKINYFNMIEAIDKTIPMLKKCPYVQKQLSILALAIKEYRTEEELQYALNQFTYGINTSWSILLTNNIYFSINDKMNVSVALEDMISELRHSKKVLEASKRLNNEGFSIIKYLVPSFYVGSIFVAMKYFGFTISKFFDYQLNNPLGFKLFLATVISFVFNYAVMVLSKRQKFDF